MEHRYPARRCAWRSGGQCAVVRVEAYRVWGTRVEGRPGDEFRGEEEGEEEGEEGGRTYAISFSRTYT